MRYQSAARQLADRKGTAAPSPSDRGSGRRGQSATSQQATGPNYAAFLLAAIGKNKLFSLWLLGSFVSGLTGFSGVAPAMVEKTAIGIFTALQGAAVTASAQEKRVKAAEEKAAVNRSQFVKDCDRLKNDQADIQQRNRELDKKDNQLIAFEANLKTRADTYKDRIFAEVSKQAQAEAAKVVTTAKEAAAKAVAMKQVELERALADKAAVQREYTEKYDKAAKTAAQVVKQTRTQYQQLGDKAAETIKVGNEVLTNERTQVNGVLSNLEQQIKALTAELGAAKELAAKLQAPKQFNQSSVEAQIGNRIQAFLTGRGVVLGAKDIGQNKFGEVPIFFEPINCDLEKVEAQLDALHLHLGLPECPAAEIENGAIKITVQASSEQKPTRSPIVAISDERIQQAFLEVVHVRFTGYTGRGKSELLNNVLDLYQDDMEVLATIFDPKVDFPSSKYPKNKVYRGPERCVGNIDLIGDVVTNRQEYKVLNDEQGVTIPAEHLKPRLFLIDECKDIYDAAGLADSEMKPSDRHNVKDYKRSIQKGLEVGRGLKVRVIYSTVTPDSSDIGFKNNVFKQSATVFLGDQCAEALAAKGQYLTTISDTKKAQLRQEYRARLAAGQKFIGLFFNGLTNEIFFFELPKPGAWKTKSDLPSFQGGSSEGELSEEMSQTPESVSPTGFEGGAETAQSQLNESGGSKMSQSAQTLSGVIPTLSEALERGGECPHCGNLSTSFKEKRRRKSDSTIRLRCKTEGCASGGFFRLQVSE